MRKRESEREREKAGVIEIEGERERGGGILELFYVIILKFVIFIVKR